MMSRNADPDVRQRPLVGSYPGLVAAKIEGRSFRDVDWYGEKLADREYRDCGFHHVDLTEATSVGAVFDQCVFDNVRFNTSRHTDSAFLRCTFARSSLFDAEFEGCKFTGSTFEESELRPLRVVGGDWSFVTLRCADLRGVTFQGVRMREADLTSADCTKATLTDLDLSGATLNKITLTGCDLRGSDVTELDPRTAAVDGAVITADQAAVIARRLGLEIRPAN